MKKAILKLRDKIWSRKQYDIEEREALMGEFLLRWKGDQKGEMSRSCGGENVLISGCCASSEINKSGI